MMYFCPCKFIVRVDISTVIHYRNNLHSCFSKKRESFYIFKHANGLYSALISSDGAITRMSLIREMDQ